MALAITPQDRDLARAQAAFQRLTDNAAMLLRTGDGKDIRSRLLLFVRWLDDTGRGWQSPDLPEYLIHLLARGLSPGSANTHLSTIRGRYRALLKDNALRCALWEIQPPDASASDRKAHVDEMIERLRNDLEPGNARAAVIQRQDTTDQEQEQRGRRLTSHQAESLMNAPGLDTLT